MPWGPSDGPLALLGRLPSPLPGGAKFGFGRCRYREALRAPATPSPTLGHMSNLRHAAHAPLMRLVMNFLQHSLSVVDQGG